MSNYKKELNESELKQVVGGVTATYNNQTYECDNLYTKGKACPNCKKSGNIYYSTFSFSDGKRVFCCGDCGHTWSSSEF